MKVHDIVADYNTMLKITEWSVRVGREFNHYLPQFSFFTEDFFGPHFLKRFASEEANFEPRFLSFDKILGMFDYVLEEYNEEVI